MKRMLMAALAAWVGCAIAAPAIPADLILRDATVVDVAAGRLVSGQAVVTRGDRILAVDGAAVDDGDVVTGFIQRRAPGTEVRLRLRGPDGREREAWAVLGELPPEPPPK